MIISRRLINMVGTLVVAIALVLGTVLTALPIHFESGTLNAQQRDVASSNQVLQAQIDGLRAQEAELPQLEQELADLQQQLPRIPQLDDASQLVVKAADKTNASIVSVTFGDFAPFAARNTAAVIEQLPKTATNVAPSEAPSPDVASGEAASSEDADAPTADPVSTTTETESPPQLQFPVTINVMVPDQPAANRFLDELRAGPRLVQIDGAQATLTERGLELTVTGLVFVSRSN
ncbi:MAG: hypothetical protein QM804_19435 [Propionicimonas sp.]